MLHIYIRKMLNDSLPIPFFFCPTEKIPSAPEIARNYDRPRKTREDAQKPNGCNYDSI